MTSVYDRVYSGFEHRSSSCSSNSNPRFRIPLPSWMTLITGIIAVISVARMIWIEKDQDNVIKNAKRILDTSISINNRSREFLDSVYTSLKELELESNQTVTTIQKMETMKQQFLYILQDLEFQLNREHERINSMTVQIDSSVLKLDLKSMIQKCLFELTGEQEIRGYIFSRLGNVTDKIENCKRLQRKYKELQKEVNHILGEHHQLRSYGVYDDLGIHKLPSEMQKQIIEGIRSVVDYIHRQKIAGKQIYGDPVVELCSPIYREQGGVQWIVGLFQDQPLVNEYETVQYVEGPGVKITGNRGNLTLNLPEKQNLTTLSIEYPYLVNETKSAPKHLRFYSCDSEPRLLCQFEYNIHGPVIQECSVNDSSQCLQLEVLSNWGNPDYTWIYGWRIYGIDNE
jgi:hypothetical protein